jgi:hypothetical protein
MGNNPRLGISCTICYYDHNTGVWVEKEVPASELLVGYKGDRVYDLEEIRGRIARGETTSLTETYLAMPDDEPVKVKRWWQFWKAR